MQLTRNYMYFADKAFTARESSRGLQSNELEAQLSIQVC